MNTIWGKVLLYRGISGIFSLLVLQSLSFIPNSFSLAGAEIQTYGILVLFGEILIINSLMNRMYKESGQTRWIKSLVVTWLSLLFGEAIYFTVRELFFADIYGAESIKRVAFGILGMPTLMTLLSLAKLYQLKTANTGLSILLGICMLYITGQVWIWVK